jgi:Cu-Zn family superoxide dismutase
MRKACVLACGIVLASCATMRGMTGGPSATADLINARGERVGTAILTEQAGHVRLIVEVEGLTPGKHGIHIHAAGKCEPPAFTTAGGHYNPLGARHGLEAPDGAHAGDLPNLVADAAGRARYEVTTSLVTVSAGLVSIFDGDGSALVIHAQEDDQKTDPTGNSGARVACGVLVRR